MLKSTLEWGNPLSTRRQNEIHFVWLLSPKTLDPRNHMKGIEYA